MCLCVSALNVNIWAQWMCFDFYLVIWAFNAFRIHCICKFNRVFWTYTLYVSVHSVRRTQWAKTPRFTTNFMMSSSSQSCLLLVRRIINIQMPHSAWIITMVCTTLNSVSDISNRLIVVNRIANRELSMVMNLLEHKMFGFFLPSSSSTSSLRLRLHRRSGCGCVRCADFSARTSKRT